MGDVVLLAPLGELPDNSATYVLEALLAANLYWQATHGATIAWSIDLSQPILQRALSESELTAAALPDALADFLTAAEDWRANVSSLAMQRPAPPEPDDDDDEEDDDLQPPPPGAEGFIAV